VLVPVSAHGSASDRNCALASHDALDDLEQVEGAAGEAVNPRHRDHVAGAETVEHAEKLAPVSARTRHLLAVDVPVGASGGAKLLKLGIERLAVGADAGIAETVILQVCFGHISRHT
jgi:hypothetical protein